MYVPYDTDKMVDKIIKLLYDMTAKNMTQSKENALDIAVEDNLYVSVRNRNVYIEYSTKENTYVKPLCTLDEFDEDEVRDLVESFLHNPSGS